MSQPRIRLPRLSALAIPALVGLITGAWPSSIHADDDAATFSEGSPASWPFHYEEKVFGDEAILDLRYLNEAQAGQSGFVRRSDDGDSFMLGDGTPVRFWGANIATGIYYGRGEISWAQSKDYAKLAQRTFKPEILRQHARWLAKMGVNLVRLHLSLPPKTPGSKVTDVNEAEIDEAFRIVAAMKAEGIYTVVSPFWPHANFMNADTSQWGIEGYETDSTWDSGTALWGLIFFNDRLQEGYRSWLKALFTRVNPYTGIPLAEDPAVAIIQLINEDSLLFGTESRIRPAQQKVLAAKFASYLRARYGSVAAAEEHWGAAGALPGDTAQAVQLLTIDEIKDLPAPGLEPRARDQFRFFVETMRSFYASTEHYLRELGCRQLINAGNWRTIDDPRMLDAERFTYTANEVMAVNTYYTSAHRGPRRAYQVNVGDTYRNKSVTETRGSFPPLVKQVEGYPTFMSETAWVYPNFYNSESPLVVAAYGSMSGIDAIGWFTFRAAPEYDTDLLTPTNIWDTARPSVVGSFPAAALIYRKAMVGQGQAVSVEHRSPEQLWDRTPSHFMEDSGFDPNRDRGHKAGGAPGDAFLVGPVKVTYDGSGADTGRLQDLASCISGDGNQIRSNTGQLLMDRARKIMSFDTPQAQGVVGFLKGAGEVKLGDIRIQSSNDFGTLAVVALDGAPIATSGRLLVQSVTGCRPTDWDVAVAADGVRTVKSLGHAPWRVERTLASIEVANAGLLHAVALDPMGRPCRIVTLTRTADGVSFKFPEDALYVILAHDPQVGASTPRTATR